MSGINVFNSAVRQFQSSQKNLMAISQARKKMERDEQLSDLKKRKAELDLEEGEITGSLNKVKRDFLKGQIDEYFKQEKTISEGRAAMIDQAEAKESAMSDQSMGLAKQVIKNDPLVQSHLGLLEPVISASSGGLVGFKRSSPTKSSTAGQFTQKDILAEARAMAKDDPEEIPYIDKVKKYLPEAESMLIGGRKDSANAQGLPSASSQVKSTTNNSKVKVKAPDGRIGYIPRENVEKAKRSGYSILQ